MESETPSPAGRRFGYVRVSKSSQDEAGQVKVLMEQGGIHRQIDIYSDRGISGAKTSRPEFDRMLGALEPGDTVVTFKLDRLGRSTGHTILLIEDLVKRDIHVESIKDGLNTRRRRAWRCCPCWPYSPRWNELSSSSARAQG